MEIIGTFHNNTLKVGPSLTLEEGQEYELKIVEIKNVNPRLLSLVGIIKNYKVEENV